MRDRLLASTPEGQRYIELYNNHTREILSLLLADPKLAETGITVLTELKPLFDKLLTGKGIETIISSKQLNTIDAFLNMLVNEGSPALQKDITDLRLKWGGFEQFAGKSIIDVQTKILGHGVFLPRLSNP
ncbi:hypothetical protein [Methylocucumis oryzae]|uniref:hypothetical protein n=1 Tax=Methylocucumis oryzae TaxID=1632867 RepID=UPI001039EDB8|nr:hypothetical protein [Methylocucumis oryzae]